MAGLQKLAQKTKRVNIKLKTTKYRYKCIHIYRKTVQNQLQLTNKSCSTQLKYESVHIYQI